jgi:hypothetical protein
LGLTPQHEVLKKRMAKQNPRRSPTQNPSFIELGQSVRALAAASARSLCFVIVFKTENLLPQTAKDGPLEARKGGPGHGIG